MLMCLVAVLLISSLRFPEAYRPYFIVVADMMVILFGCKSIYSIEYTLSNNITCTEIEKSIQVKIVTVSSQYCSK